MQLQNNLYTIQAKQIEAGKGSFAISLNPSCFIYQAHFPGEPVTPGVCIVQMGKELLEEFVQKPLYLTTIKNVKFLSVLSPAETPAVTYLFNKVVLSEDGTEVKAQIVVVAGEAPKAKLSLVCNTNKAWK